MACTPDRDTMIFLVFSVSLLLGEFCSSCSCAQVYVVYMGKGLQGSSENRHDMLRLHHQMLTAVHDGSMEKAKASHVYTYSNGFQGFAAKLNKQQAMKLADMPGVISVFPNTKRSLHTTHSWDFMGLSVNAMAEVPELSSKNQENIIIGFIDTGEEYGQNPLASEIMECLQFLQDGEGNASVERQTHRQISPAKTILGSRDAPRVAAFSSRGPNSLTPEILKPDIAAPGLNILAAWSPAKEDKHFNILSGTSMACPHVTGIAALVKGAYPSWSPSAIKSAIMTTATVLDNKRNAIAMDPNGRTATPLDFGSGFADPIKALNPGIIFDTHPEDYKSFLCAIGYDDHSLRLITRDNSTCTDRAPSSAANLNYPSITIPNLKKSYSVTRTMTNVGCRGSSYRALVSAPRGINVTVTPKVLVFENYGAKKTFTVNFHVDVPHQDYVFGSLLWDGTDARLIMPLVVKVQTAAKA